MATLTKELIGKTGSMVSTALVKQEISWTSDGETHTADVYIKPLSFHSIVAGIHSGDQVVSRVVTCVCDEDGNSIFTAEEVKQLCESLSFALLAAIGIASGVQPAKTEARKNSKPKKKSGTS